MRVFLVSVSKTAIIRRISKCRAARRPEKIWIVPEICLLSRLPGKIHPGQSQFRLLFIYNKYLYYFQIIRLFFPIIHEQFIEITFD
jgi:hypothetical protein